MLIGMCMLISLVSLYVVIKLLKSEGGIDTELSRQVKTTQRITIKLTKVEVFVLTILFMSLGMVVGWIFYKSKIMMVIFALVFQLIHKIYIKEKKLKFKEQSLDEFLEINRILIAELYSGKSLESAYKEILHNLSKDNINQYPIMYQNLTNWCEQFEVGRSIEEVLKTFAHQNEDEVMEQFVDMICVTKEHGGNLLEVIELTNRVLREKRQIKIDIGVMISEKKLEQKVLSLMPFGMLILMQLTAYEFISPLYESLSGRMMMTLALFVFISCYMWSNHMTRFDT